MPKIILRFPSISGELEHEALGPSDGGWVASDGTWFPCSMIAEVRGFYDSDDLEALASAGEFVEPQKPQTGKKR